MKVLLYRPVVAFYVVLMFVGCSKEKEIDFSRYNIKAVTTGAVSQITRSTGTVSGEVYTDNGAAVTERGICYNITPNPTINNFKTKETANVRQSSFSVTVQNLIPGTTYYAKAYATNKHGTAYGEEISFTTEKAVLATVNTLTVSNISRNAAIATGNITDNGGFPVTRRGFCYSNVTNSPRIENTPTINTGSGNGNFTGNLSGLLPGTRYYARAFAITQLGASYGPSISFETLSLSVPGNIQAVQVSNITSDGAYASASVGDDGGSPITSRGFVYSNLNPNPVIGGSSVQSAGSGTGGFNAVLSSLLPNMNYFIRAFAYNSAGFVYGPVIQFKTLPAISIGESYQGGTVAYIFQPGDPGYIAGQVHGLIAAGSIVQRVWGCQQTSISTSPNLGTGLTNTVNIINNCTGSTAARYCYDLIYNGYSDWYLPSYIELQKIYDKMSANKVPAYPYWTSSQDSNMPQTAYLVHFADRYFVNHPKGNLAYVLPVRSF